MKYIVMRVEDEDPKKMSLEVPFAFPTIIVHSCMAAQMAALLHMQYPTSAKIYPISAGEFSSLGWNECHGESTSLKLKSRGEEDDQLFSMCDYGSIFK